MGGLFSRYRCALAEQGCRTRRSERHILYPCSVQRLWRSPLAKPEAGQRAIVEAIIPIEVAGRGTRLGRRTCRDRHREGRGETSNQHDALQHSHSCPFRTVVNSPGTAPAPADA